MSKSALILIALCFCVGVAIVLFTPFNPVTIITNFTASPVDTLNSLTETVTQYWQPLATGVGGAISALMLVSRQYSRKKEEAQEIQNVMQGQLLEANQATAKVEGQVEAQKTTITQQSEVITGKEEQISQLKLSIQQLEDHNRRLVQNQQFSKKLTKDEVITLVHKETRKP